MGSYRLEVATKKWREVEAAVGGAGTGVNGGDYDWITPAVYREDFLVADHLIVKDDVAGLPAGALTQGPYGGVLVVGGQADPGDQPAEVNGSLLALSGGSIYFVRDSELGGLNPNAEYTLKVGDLVTMPDGRVGRPLLVASEIIPEFEDENTDPTDYLLTLVPQEIVAVTLVNTYGPTASIHYQVQLSNTGNQSTDITIEILLNAGIIASQTYPVASSAPLQSGSFPSPAALVATDILSIEAYASDVSGNRLPEILGSANPSVIGVTQGSLAREASVASAATGARYMRSPDGTYWKVEINDLGNITTTDLGAHP
ncbi:MAG: hypothetical protein DRR06_19390 [Gammaproteobacteria bacterium]|nr:MAG: hypothetical protein DRR06_19390 [Gammaproteobacteria bacterium]